MVKIRDPRKLVSSTLSRFRIPPEGRAGPASRLRATALRNAASECLLDAGQWQEQFDQAACDAGHDEKADSLSGRAPDAMRAAARALRIGL
jgi:hypothetical protein